MRANALSTIMARDSFANTGVFFLFSSATACSVSQQHSGRRRAPAGAPVTLCGLSFLVLVVAVHLPIFLHGQFLDVVASALILYGLDEVLRHLKVGHERHVVVRGKSANSVVGLLPN